jgi:hypothetical protein
MKEMGRPQDDLVTRLSRQLGASRGVIKMTLRHLRGTVLCLDHAETIEALERVLQHDGSAEWRIWPPQPEK